MAEVVTKVIMDKDDLQPLADEIKELGGVSGAITLGQMETKLQDANAEISEQDALVEQLISAMQGKSVPPSVGEGGSIETCTVTIIFPAGLMYIARQRHTGSVDGKIEFFSLEDTAPDDEGVYIINNVVCNTMMRISFNRALYASEYQASYENGLECVLTGIGSGDFYLLATQSSPSPTLRITKKQSSDELEPA